MHMVSFPKLLLEQAKESATARGQLLSLYERYLHLLARLQIGRRLQGKVDPADVVQETFLEAHRQFPQFRGTTEAELTVWLRRILAGQIALTIRRFAGTKARDIHLERELEDDLNRSSTALDRGLMASTSTPSLRASRREQALLLAEALGQIPENYREVIILRNLEQLSFADVASRMNRTEASVQKLYVRGLAALRDAMGDES
jgi:RNA polymerase sigma-70 factor (ECF subfamily)